MARTGENENKQANQQMTAIQMDQIRRANEATDRYNKELDTLQAKGNPWADKDYLRSQNLLAASASSATNNAAKGMLDDEAIRTGDNTEARKATIADLARQKMRVMTDYQAGRQADDYNKYVDYQRWLTAARLDPASVNANLFGSATSGRDAALGNLTELGKAGYGMWGNIIGGVAGGVGSVYSGKGKT